MKGTHLLFVLVMMSQAMTTFCCFEQCTQKFMTDMSALSANETGVPGFQMTSNFCRLMTQQISCLNTAMFNCTPERRTLVQNMLGIFIMPDYQRTCAQYSVGTTMNQEDFNSTLVSVVPTSSFTPTSGRLLNVCREKMMNCQNKFNQTSLTSSKNVTEFCQGLRDFTLCFVDLLSTECGHLVNRNHLKSMQEQHAAMCSENAQTNANNMMECANKTTNCYASFNTSFTPALKEYNLMTMCSSLADFTECMHDVTKATQCALFGSQTLANIAQLKNRHHAYCGDDNGQTAKRCAEDFQSCYTGFNKTFFPALHSGDLTTLCRSLNTYTSCLSKLSPECSVQLEQMIRSAQFLSLQFRDRCHPKILKLANCSQIMTCSSKFMTNFTSFPSSTKLCGNLGEYFQCVADGLDACQLPQSSTDVSFSELGHLIQDYCEKVSTNQKLLKCNAFVTCSSAVSVTFTPTLKSLFDGTSWCTFMKLNVGCAEHALQSAMCYLDQDIQLLNSINNLDRSRISTCDNERQAAVDLTHKDETSHGQKSDNEINIGADLTHKGAAVHGQKNSGLRLRSYSPTVMSALLMFAFK